MTKENADISRFSKILQPGVKVYKCQKKYHYQKLTFIVLFWFLIKNRFIQKKKIQRCALITLFYMKHHTTHITFICSYQLFKDMCLKRCLWLHTYVYIQFRNQTICSQNFRKFLLHYEDVNVMCPSEFRNVLNQYNSPCPISPVKIIHLLIHVE